MVIRAAVLGHPVSQSLSPRIYTSWFADADMDGAYEALDVSEDSFADVVHRLMAQGYRGANVTVPHKARALAMADTASPAAVAIGASNLLIFRNGAIHADNTDAFGFEMALRERSAPLHGANAVVLGAGGAARAILHALRGFGRVTVLNRTRQRAEDLAGAFLNAAPGSWEDRSALASAGPDLLVNATSLGMAGQPALEIDLGAAPPKWVADIVYKPLRTPLLQVAEAAGSVTIDGLAMLVYQAVPSFLAYAGRDPRDPSALLAALRAEFS